MYSISTKQRFTVPQQTVGVQLDSATASRYTQGTQGEYAVGSVICVLPKRSGENPLLAAFGRALMRIGIIALSVAFLASGIMNLMRPAASWKPSAGNPDEKPPEDLIRRNRRIGMLWCALGLLVGAYVVQSLLAGG